MSWTLFWQLVILMLLAGVIVTSIVTAAIKDLRKGDE